MAKKTVVPAAPAPWTPNANWVNAFTNLGAKAPTNIDWDRYLAANPDATNHWNSDDLGIAALKNAGITEKQYAASHYVNDGSRRNIADFDLNKIAADEAAAKAAQAEAARLERIRLANEQTAADNAARDREQAAIKNIGVEKIKEQATDPAYAAFQQNIYDTIQLLVDAIPKGVDPRNAIDPEVVAENQRVAEENRQRRELGVKVNNTFGANYSKDLISDSFLDDTINEILSTQASGATDYLDRGKARGIYDDIGYNAGLKRIGDSRAIGASELNTLENGVLSKYRTQADDIVNKARSAASGFTVGTNFNLDDYINQGKTVADQFGQFGGGDLRSALGGKNFFDFGELANAAGQAQGATNLRDDNIMAALTQRKKGNSVSRGLGSQGAF